jgi:plastocyanin
MSAVALALVVAAGCRSSGVDSADGEDTISPASSTTSVVSITSCADVEPGIVVDRTLAVIHFDREKVCPGWVTVEQGTQVTFLNDDSVEHTVVVTATQLPDSAELARFTIAAGATQPFDTLDPARMGYATDALPGFRGTIEVVEPGGGVQH